MEVERTGGIGHDLLHHTPHLQVAVGVIGIADRHRHVRVRRDVAILLPFGGVGEPQHLAVPVEPHRIHLGVATGSRRGQMPVQRALQQRFVPLRNVDHHNPLSNRRRSTTSSQPALAQFPSSVDTVVSLAVFRSSTVSMGFGYIRRRCTSKAKHSSATSLGRERDRPVCFSIRRSRWRTVFGWQLSTAAAAHTDASLSCHTRNVSKSVSRSSSGRSPKPCNTAPTVLIIVSGALTAAVARMEPSNTATEEVESAGPRTITRAKCRARGVSRRSLKAALTPTRTVVIRDSRATTLSSF